MDISYILSRLDPLQIASTFIVLFAVIDVLGSTPIFIDLKQQGRPVNALKATLISTSLLIGFFFAGDVMLRLFNVDIESFAVAGSLVIFLLALEMILDVVIFKNQGPIKEATLVPVVFPLIAGAGSFTTLLSLRAEYAQVNIIIGLAFCPGDVFICSLRSSAVAVPFLNGRFPTQNGRSFFNQVT